jgi:hypothetical protein
MFALRWNHIEAGRVRVDGSTSPWRMKEPKTHGSDAFIPMPSSVQLEMDLWRGLQRVSAPASVAEKVQ